MGGVGEGVRERGLGRERGGEFGLTWADVYRTRKTFSYKQSKNR